jgi:hypothetical protein
VSTRIEIPFPPHHSELPAARMEPPWVPVEPRWEYKQVVRDLAIEQVLSEAELNTLGDEHWELAGIVREDHRTHFYFKRERAH